MNKNYDPKEIESKWQKVWMDEKAFAATDDYTKPKYYALVEFPYPSGQNCKCVIFKINRSPLQSDNFFPAQTIKRSQLNGNFQRMTLNDIK